MTKTKLEKLLYERDQRIDQLKFQLADIATENGRLKKQLAVAVDALKKFSCDHNDAYDGLGCCFSARALKQIEEMETEYKI